MTTLEAAPKMSKKEATDKVALVLQEVSLMGANDSEIPELNQIMRDIEDEIGDREALVERAYQIKAGKQDYH